jgi:hypothetical protein
MKFITNDYDFKYKEHENIKSVEYKKYKCIYTTILASWCVCVLCKPSTVVCRCAGRGRGSALVLHVRTRNQTSECNFVESKETESPENENAKIVCENIVDCIFYAKIIIHQTVVSEKQTVNGKFYKDVIKRLIARVHRVRPEFQESGSLYILHDNAPAHSSDVDSEFLAKRGIPVLSHPPYSPDLAPAHRFFIS